MNAKEIFDYWQNAMALSSKSVFANLEHYLIESGEVGLELLNSNLNLLSPVVDVQKLTLEMQNKVSAIENKKYFFKLAETEMAKAMRVLGCKFDQTYRLLVQLGMDVSGWTVDNFFDKLKELDADVPGEPTEASDPEASDPEASDPEASDPEASDPEASDPEASDPEASDPEASDPEASDPEASDPEASDPKVRKSRKK